MPAFILYTVQPSDTLGDIAVRYDTTVPELARFNGLREPDRIYPGQRLRVPRPDASQPSRPPRPPREDTYVVQAGDTLGAIAFRYGTTVPVLLRLNQLDDPDALYIGQELRVPAARPDGGRVHEVMPGDTLYSIAGEHDTTVEELIRLNGIRTPNLIYPGERIRLP